MPRKRHVSRNGVYAITAQDVTGVMPRKRHVSRNLGNLHQTLTGPVMPRKRHVSRNTKAPVTRYGGQGHASQEACE